MGLWKTLKGLFGVRETAAESSQSPHQTPPIPNQAVPTDMVEQLFEVTASAWGTHVIGLMELIGGKVVTQASAGHSGYMLEFEDHSWVMCFVDPDTARMDWRTGTGKAEETELALMHSEQCADAAECGPEDRPYAADRCRIENEVRNTIGKPVLGISLGCNSYNLCFPEGFEVDATVFQVGEKPALRVFWEKW